MFYLLVEDEVEQFRAYMEEYREGEYVYRDIDED